MNDIRDLLDLATPEPDRFLDPDQVLRTARRRSTRTRRVAASSVAALTLVLALPLALGQRGVDGERGAGGLAAGNVPLTLSVLDRRVPLGEVAVGAVQSPTPLHAGEGSLVGTVGDEELWLVEAADDNLCLLSVYEKYGAAGTACHPRQDLLTTGVMLDTQGVRPGAPALLVVAVPDGYTSATVGTAAARVLRNVAVFAFDGLTTPTGVVTVSGEELPPVSFDLQDSLPVGPRSAPGRDGLAGDEAAVRLQLTELVRRADAHNRAQGSTAGFLAALPEADRRRLSAGLLKLTDSTALARYGPACLQADLRAALIQSAAC